MDILPPHPPPPSSGGATSPPPRPNTIPPQNLPPVPSVAPSASAQIATPSATAIASSSPSTPDDRSTAFHSVDATAEREGLGTTLLVEAYAAIWIIMMGFVLLGWRKQGALNARLNDLEKAIDKSEAAKQKKA